VRLLAVGVDVVAAIGGAATNYAAPVEPQISIEFYDKDGKRVEPPAPLEDLDEILALAEQHEARQVQTLPCNDWSPDHADASPTPVENEPAVQAIGRDERATNPDLIDGPKRTPTCGANPRCCSSAGLRRPAPNAETGTRKAN
jgi:hypothetical protein